MVHFVSLVVEDEMMNCVCWMIPVFLSAAAGVAAALAAALVSFPRHIQH